MMQILRKMVNVLPPRLSELPIGVKHYLFNRKEIKAMLREVSFYEKKYNDEHPETNLQTKRFFNNLRKYCLFFDRAGADSFLKSYFSYGDLHLLKKSSCGELSSDSVILICCVYNDARRIKKVYEHHKTIGVSHFVFVDNMSDDGTTQWLLSQDVDVYQTDEKYSAGAKAAWVRKIQDIYGYDRWYLIVDSDELFSYVGMEDNSIENLIQKAAQNNCFRVRSLLLDMYPEHDIYKESPEKDFLSEYRFFDCDSYYYARDCRGEMLRGGPRARVFDYPKGYDNPLTKYPLVYFSKEDIWGDHTPVPFKKNFGCPLISVLRHYKFMDGDLQKYERIAEKGNYYGNSVEYKAYVKRGVGVSFFFSGSKEYQNSYSLNELMLLAKNANTYGWG